MTDLIEALVRSVHALQERRDDVRWTGPVYLTEQQAELLLRESGQVKPDDWDEQVAAEFEGSTVLGLPVRLAATVEESTPYRGVDQCMNADDWTVLRSGPPFEPHVERGHSSDPCHVQPSGILSVPRAMSEDDFQRLERRWRWAIKAQGNALEILHPDGSHAGWFGRRPAWWKRAYYRLRMWLA